MPYGDVGQVAAVEADAVALAEGALVAQVLESLDRVRYAGLEGVIGICQKNACVGIHIAVCLEGGQFIREAHDPAVRVRALYRDAEKLAAKDVGCADAARDDCRACAVGAGVGALRAAKAEFHDPVAAGRVADARRFGGDQALVVDDVEDRGLYQLRLHDRGDDLDHGLSGEHQGSFRNCVDAAGKLEIGKVLKEVLVKNIETAQVLDVLLAEVQFFDILDQLLNTAHDRVAAAKRVVAEESVEDDGVVLFLILKIALHHCKLIKVCEQCQVLSVHIFPPYKQKTSDGYRSSH